MMNFLTRRHWLWGAGVSLAAWFAACSSSQADSNSSAGYDNGPSYNYNVGGKSGYSTVNQGASTGGLAPEVKVTIAVETPKASENYVFAANPDRNSVAVIDPANLAIQTVSVEAGPRALQTVPGSDAALVVNTGSSSVSLLTTAASGATKATTLPVMRGANVVAVAPDGQHALVYYDSAQPSSGPLPDSPQSVTAVDLSVAAPGAYQVTVGYHPTQVLFSKDGAQAFVVSDDGISMVDLKHIATAANRITQNIRMYDATITSAAKVSVTPEGTFAIAHLEDSPIIRLVDLATKGFSDLDLSRFVNGAVDAGAGAAFDISDVALAPGGQFVLAVERASHTVLRVPIPDGFDNPDTVVRIKLPDVLIGLADMSPDGHYAVLYTSLASSNEQRICILDLVANNTVTTVNLHKSVKGVAFDPTGKTAFILHNKSTGDPKATGLTLEQVTARRYGYSLLDLSSATAKLQFTDSQPGSLAALPDGSALFILFPDVAPWSVQRVELASFAVDPISIGSQPTGIGFVSKARQIFVSQAQTDGRMTFIDWSTLKIRSVAGYELNSNTWE